jgi:hypothetical protein
VTPKAAEAGRSVVPRRHWMQAFQDLVDPAQKPVLTEIGLWNKGKNGDFNDDFMIFQGFFMVIW